MSSAVNPRRKSLALYPVFLMYVSVGFLIIAINWIPKKIYVYGNVKKANRVTMDRNFVIRQLYTVFWISDDHSEFAVPVHRRSFICINMFFDPKLYISVSNLTIILDMNTIFVLDETWSVWSLIITKVCFQRRTVTWNASAGYGQFSLTRNLKRSWIKPGEPTI